MQHLHVVEAVFERFQAFIKMTEMDLTLSCTLKERQY